LDVGDRSGDTGGMRQRSALSAGDAPERDAQRPGDHDVPQPGRRLTGEEGQGPGAGGVRQRPDQDEGETAEQAGKPAKQGVTPSRSGRNLPVAAGVGLLLGGLALLTLLTVKDTFLALMAVAAAAALWEMSRALGSRGIHVPVIPVALGGAALWACEYWVSDRAVLAAFVITVVVVLAWRLPGGTDGYLRDVMAGIFVLVYVPLLAVFIVAMLAPADGARRVLLFIILTICSDIGGYFAGSLLGRHPMARVISPNKTWEGLAGSVLACLAAGAILLPVLLGGHVWQGVLTGAGAVTSAILGDLAESAIKRDLKIKDMGSVLPGHGGVLDRIDSLLVSAPVTWLLLAVFLPGRS
jgi:phosphatidate cytidylyltransferase